MAHQASGVPGGAIRHWSSPNPIGGNDQGVAVYMDRVEQRRIAHRFCLLMTIIRAAMATNVLCVTLTARYRRGDRQCVHGVGSYRACACQLVSSVKRPSARISLATRSPWSSCRKWEAPVILT